MFDKEYEADAYDVTCRVCDDWSFENVAPGIALMHLMAHSQYHDVSAIGEPWWALRVVAGVKGNPDGPVHRTPDDGWNRPPTLERGDR